MPRKRNEPIDVFKFIDMPKNGDPKPCWPWTGGVGGRADDQRGYFTMKGIKYLAYRVVFELVNGPLAGPEEKVRHTCDNPICCNPYHLIRGTHAQNEQDKYERDRYGFPVAVVEECLKLAARALPQVAISAIITEQFGIQFSQQRVSDIVNGARRDRQAQLIRRRLEKENALKAG